jgi:hypothetical protein
MPGPKALLGGSPGPYLRRTLLADCKGSAAAVTKNPPLHALQHVLHKQLHKQGTSATYLYISREQLHKVLQREGRGATYPQQQQGANATARPCKYRGNSYTSCCSGRAEMPHTLGKQQGAIATQGFAA